ncbi:ogr/Delta-like zinc finger family protein [Salmonella enterica subsp. enterica serovar Kokomlemle]
MSAAISLGIVITTAPPCCRNLVSDIVKPPLCNFVSLRIISLSHKVTQCFRVAASYLCYTSCNKKRNKWVFMTSVLRIKCPVCHCKAAIRKTAWQDDAKTLAFIYCHCTNADCNMRFRYNFEMNRIISPSDLQTDGVVKALLQRLKPDEKRMALDILLNDDA